MSEFEDIAIETIQQNVERKKTKTTNTAQSLSELFGSFKRPNICIFRV